MGSCRRDALILTFELMRAAWSRPVMLAEYSGLLMSEELYERFLRKYYCPTALRLPTLDYYLGDLEPAACHEVGEEEAAGKQKRRRVAARAPPPTRPNQGRRKVEMTLVGDPTLPGVIINDGAVCHLPGELRMPANGMARRSLAGCTSQARALRYDKLIQCAISCVPVDARYSELRV
jgi:hypothetical protein